MHGFNDCHIILLFRNLLYRLSIRVTTLFKSKGHNGHQWNFGQGKLNDFIQLFSVPFIMTKPMTND